MKTSYLFRIQINKDRSERKTRRFGRLNYHPKQAFEIRHFHAFNKTYLLCSRMRRQIAPILLEPEWKNLLEKDDFQGG